MRIGLLVRVAALFFVAAPAHGLAQQVIPPSAGSTVVLHSAYPGQSAFVVLPGSVISSPTNAVSGNNNQSWSFTNSGSLQAGTGASARNSGLFLGSASPGQAVVYNYGTISSIDTQPSGAAGVRFSRGGQVYNYSSGVIVGLDGIHADGGQLLVNNLGAITSNIGHNSGVYSGGGGAVYNLAGGTIHSNGFGVNLNGRNVNGLVDNSGLIQANNIGVNFYNGLGFALINRAGGQIIGNNGAMAANSAQGYLLNFGALRAGNPNAATVSFSGATENILVNAGLIESSGANGVAIQTSNNEAGALIYNLGTATGAVAVHINGSNSWLILGENAFLPRLNMTVTGPGSVLNGNAVSSGVNNSIRLTDAGVEDSTFTGFAALAMDGSAWTLSAPLAVNALQVHSGVLRLTAPALDLVALGTAGGSLLVEEGAALQAGDIHLAGPAASAVFRGTANIGAINVTSGSLFRLDSSSARVSIAPGASLGLSAGARFGVGVSRNESAHAILYVDSFAPDQGAILDTPNVRLPSGGLAATSGISSLPGGRMFTFSGVVQAQTPVLIPASMQFADNNMFRLGMFQNPLNPNFADISVAVRTINQAFGPNFEAADVWRLTDLPPATQRGWLDDIYKTGQLSRDARHFFKLLQGGPVVGAQEAVRQNWQTFTASLRNRSTAAFAGQASPTAAPAAENLMWGHIRQQWSHLNGAGPEHLAGYDYNPVHFTLGLERARGAWRTGLAAQYSDGKVSSLGDAATSIIQGGLLGVYGQYSLGNWYALTSLQAGAARVRYRTDYGAWGGDTHAAYTAYQLGADSEVGYHFYFGPAGKEWIITPHAGLAGAWLKQNAFTEQGDAHLTRHFAANAYTPAEAPLGLRVAKNFTTAQADVFVFLDLAYAWGLGESAAHSEAGFSGADGAWPVRGIAAGRDALRVNGGLSILPDENLSLDLTYALEARDNYTAQSLGLGLRVNF